MPKLQEFIEIIKQSFPDDRLTYQRAIPTFHPETSGEAATFFKLACHHGQRTFITGFGNNVDPVGERFAGLIAVRTDRLNKVHEISEAGLYIKVGSGFPLMELNHELASHKLFVPHSGLPYVGSVGGALAVNLSADLHGVDLPLRRFLLRAEVVSAAGEVLDAGTPNLRVAGGQDIAGIFASSWGLLGLIVSITFRTVPASGLADYGALKLKSVERSSPLLADSQSTDRAYHLKIKDRFDPCGILPAL